MAKQREQTWEYQVLSEDDCAGDSTMVNAELNARAASEGRQPPRILTVEEIARQQANIHAGRATADYHHETQK